VDGRGVLLLSEFAGAAEEMADGSTLINPYDPEGCALKLRDALTLPAAERAANMERLGKGMKTIYDWMGDVFTRWGEVAAGLPALPADEAEEDDELFAVSPAPGRGYSGGDE
jgi:trehalose-6-phosphate synthase